MAGEKVEAKPAAAPAPAPKPAAAPSGGAPAGGSVSGDSKLWAALCYVFPVIVGIIVLVTDKKNDKYVLFHAYQSLAAGIALWVLGMVITVVTFGIGGLCFPILWLVFLYFAWKAYQGEKFMLPVVGDFAEKQMAK